LLALGRVGGGVSPSRALPAVVPSAPPPQRHGDGGALGRHPPPPVIARRAPRQPLQPAPQLAPDVRRVLEQLVVAAARLRAARQRTASVSPVAT